MSFYNLVLCVSIFIVTNVAVRNWHVLLGIILNTWLFVFVFSGLGYFIFMTGFYEPVFNLSKFNSGALLWVASALVIPIDYMFFKYLGKFRDNDQVKKFYDKLISKIKNIL